MITEGLTRECKYCLKKNNQNVTYRLKDNKVTICEECIVAAFDYIFGEIKKLPEDKEDFAAELNAVSKVI